MTTVTVLTSHGQLLTKVHKRLDDGSIQTKPYANAKSFSAELVPLSSIYDFAALLGELQGEAYKAIIRGEPRPGADLKNLNRKMSPPNSHDDREPDIVPNLEGKRWLKLDLDNLAMPRSDALEYDGDSITGVRDPQAAVRSIITTYLPEYFHGVTTYYSFSASAGIKPWTEVRLGLYYFMKTPVPDKALRLWAKRLGAIDPAVFTPNQLNYTAAPLVFRMDDPCAGWRSGLIEGKAWTS